MTGFSEQFEHFVPPDQDTIRDGIVNGLVVLDSNVLLSAYRFAPKSRAELLNVLESLGARIWVPHQVGLEFHRNRLKVIAEYDAAYKEAIDTFARHQNEFKPEFEKKLRELSNRVALPDEERDNLIATLASSFKQLDMMLQNLRTSHGVGGPATPDPILEKISQILGDKIGAPFEEEVRSREMEESAKRIEKRIPPGFKDSGKDEPHGDYFVWCQSLREAQRRNSSILVFVTNDAKEDWYLRLKGQTVMARPELARECLDEANARLVMLPARLFLSYAKRYLQAEVSDETIRQADKAAVDEDAKFAAEVRSQLDQARHAEANISRRVRDLEDRKIEAELMVFEARQSLIEADSRKRSYEARIAAGIASATGEEAVEVNNLLAKRQMELQIANKRLSSINEVIENEVRQRESARRMLEAVNHDWDEISALVEPGVAWWAVLNDLDSRH